MKAIHNHTSVIRGPSSAVINEGKEQFESYSQHRWACLKVMEAVINEGKEQFTRDVLIFKGTHDSCGIESLKAPNHYWFFDSGL